MNPFTITLPDWVDESTLPKLLNRLSQGDQYDEIDIDIARVKFLVPAAIVAVLARYHRWLHRDRKVVKFVGLEACQSLGYLQRMDFLRCLGIDHPENFVRHPEADRFVPVRTLNFATGNVDVVASEITRCVFPETDPSDGAYQALQYAAGELLSNAKYHSGGRAFACAQFFPKRSLVRIAVADDGAGIRHSFLATSREQDASDPNAAIRLALQPGVSSALLRPNPNPYGGQNHRGVGLSVTRILAQKAFGQLTIASDSGWFDEVQGEEQTPITKQFDFPGTLVAVSLHRDHIADYAEMHAEAMEEIGMSNLDSDAMFVE
jgi:hypothetical protein